ncbi:MAG: large conductance mechanosensitive channel protein MscL [Nocardioidaceae bacterium]|nr:large conductance mechanosensitive channel protein MscL [Nocardioidaceae bacterium]
MLKGFKEFLLRGNVIDLAVAVVIGTAFVALVTAFTTYLIDPIIAAAGGDDAVQGLGFEIRDGNAATFVDVGAIITAIITFVLVAAVVYVVFVVAMKRLTALVANAPEPAAAPPDVQLLTEIRDLLRQRQGGGVPPPTA